MKKIIIKILQIILLIIAFMLSINNLLIIRADDGTAYGSFKFTATPPGGEAKTTEYGNLRPQVNNTNGAANGSLSGASAALGNGGAADGTDPVPSDAVPGLPYTPDQLPESLKDYVIDPAEYGLEYLGPGGWVEHSGQCVDLTESLGNALYNNTGVTVGDGIAQAGAWAAKFGNSTKSTPVKGAIFSSGEGGGAGHTGIVCHTFEDGSILVVEQNVTGYSGALAGMINTWSYRVMTPDQQAADGMHFAYPD